VAEQSPAGSKFLLLIARRNKAETPHTSAANHQCDGHAFCTRSTAAAFGVTTFSQDFTLPDRIRQGEAFRHDAFKAHHARAYSNIILPSPVPTPNVKSLWAAIIYTGRLLPR
jgi:hypothetical protein